jgi:hypothetical protein
MLFKHRDGPRTGRLLSATDNGQLTADQNKRTLPPWRWKGSRRLFPIELWIGASSSESSRISLVDTVATTWFAGRSLQAQSSAATRPTDITRSYFFFVVFLVDFFEDDFFVPPFFMAMRVTSFLSATM